MLTQLPRVPSLIPSSLATRAIGREVSITIFTASSRNSGEKLFFGRGNYFTFPDIHPNGWTVRKPRGTPVGEGGPDAGLDLLGAVEDLDVQGGEQVLDQGGGGVGEGGGQVGQFVEQGGVLLRGGGGVEGVELGLGGGALVVVFAVAGADAGPVGLGGRAGVGAELFQFGEQPGLGDLDPGQVGGEAGVLAGAGGGVLGGGGGDAVFEHGGPVVPEDVLVQERGDGGHNGVLADGHRGDGVAGAGRGVAGVGSLVRAAAGSSRTVTRACSPVGREVGR